jgi:glutathione peroxidase-family protein
MASIYDLEMTGIDGEQVDFDRFRDQVLLIVNVASR